MAAGFDYQRILKVDYVAYFSLWIMVLPWLFVLLVFLPGSKISVLYVAAGAIIISLVGLVLLIRRICFLKYLYVQGVDSVGYITSIDHDGYRRRQSMLELEHEFQNEGYKILIDLRHSAFYKCHFRKGDALIIRFNPEKPCEGIIRDAYFSMNRNTSFTAPQLSESAAENKLTYMDLNFILREFVFANRWVSDRIDTTLSFEQFTNTVMEFCRQNYIVDEKRNRVLLRNNFFLIIDSSKFTDNNIFSLEFQRRYHRIYAVYVVLAIIVSFAIMPFLAFPKNAGFVLIIFMLPIAFIWMAYELVRGIRNIKPIDYGMEAERVYFEILDAIRKKENEIGES